MTKPQGEPEPELFITQGSLRKHRCQGPGRRQSRREGASEANESGEREWAGGESLCTRLKSLLNFESTWGCERLLPQIRSTFQEEDQQQSRKGMAEEVAKTVM